METEETETQTTERNVNPKFDSQAWSSSSLNHQYEVDGALDERDIDAMLGALDSVHVEGADDANVSLPKGTVSALFRGYLQPGYLRADLLELHVLSVPPLKLYNHKIDHDCRKNIPGRAQASSQQ